MSRSLESMVLLELLHRAGQIAERVFDMRTRGLSLTARQFSILAVAASSEGLSQAAIVHSTGIDRSTVAELVRRLVSRGLLQRRRARGDGRTYQIRLTPAGRAILAEAEPAARDADALVSARVRSLSRGQFREALIEVISADVVPEIERVPLNRTRPESVT